MMNENDTSELEPRTELLRGMGWNIKATFGQYCVVWRGQLEVLMVWRNGRWERASGGEGRKAA